jgi:hypothetical protein
MGMPADIGIVDLGIGFPYGSAEEKVRTYDFFRANRKDAESLREMECPARTSGPLRALGHRAPEPGHRRAARLRDSGSGRATGRPFAG